MNLLTFDIQNTCDQQIYIKICNNDKFEQDFSLTYTYNQYYNTSSSSSGLNFKNTNNQDKNNYQNKNLQRNGINNNFKNKMKSLIGQNQILGNVILNNNNNNNNCILMSSSIGSQFSSLQNTLKNGFGFNLNNNNNLNNNSKQKLKERQSKIQNFNNSSSRNNTFYQLNSQKNSSSSFFFNTLDSPNYNQNINNNNIKNLNTPLLVQKIDSYSFKKRKLTNYYPQIKLTVYRQKGKYKVHQWNIDFDRLYCQQNYFTSELGTHVKKQFDSCIVSLTINKIQEDCLGGTLARILISNKQKQKEKEKSVKDILNEDSNINNKLPSASIHSNGNGKSNKSIKKVITANDVFQQKANKSANTFIQSIFAQSLLSVKLQLIDIEKKNQKKAEIKKKLMFQAGKIKNSRGSMFKSNANGNNSNFGHTSSSFLNKNSNIYGIQGSPGKQRKSQYGSFLNPVNLQKDQKDRTSNPYHSQYHQNQTQRQNIKTNRSGYSNKKSSKRVSQSLFHSNKQRNFSVDIGLKDFKNQLEFLSSFYHQNQNQKNKSINKAQKQKQEEEFNRISGVQQILTQKINQKYSQLQQKSSQSKNSLSSGKINIKRISRRPSKRKSTLLQNDNQSESCSNLTSSNESKKQIRFKKQVQQIKNQKDSLRNILTQNNEKEEQEQVYIQKQNPKTKQSIFKTLKRSNTFFKLNQQQNQQQQQNQSQQQQSINSNNIKGQNSKSNYSKNKYNIQDRYKIALHQQKNNFQFDFDFNFDIDIDFNIEQKIADFNRARVQKYNQLQKLYLLKHSNFSYNLNNLNNLNNFIYTNLIEENQSSNNDQKCKNNQLKQKLQTQIQKQLKIQKQLSNNNNINDINKENSLKNGNHKKYHWNCNSVNRTPYFYIRNKKNHNNHNADGIQLDQRYQDIFVRIFPPASALPYKNNCIRY